jgi:Domain of unknown function (DUF4282)
VVSATPSDERSVKNLRAALLRSGMVLSSERAIEMNEQAKGFFGSLFDLSFSHFAAPRISKVVYVVAMALSGLASVLMALSTFSISPALGAVVLLVVVPVMWVWCLIWTRVGLELAMAVFAIAENTRSRPGPARPTVFGPPVPPVP